MIRATTEWALFNVINIIWTWPKIPKGFLSDWRFFQSSSQFWCLLCTSSEIGTRIKWIIRNQTQSLTLWSLCLFTLMETEFCDTDQGMVNNGKMKESDGRNGNRKRWAEKSESDIWKQERKKYPQRLRNTQYCPIYKSTLLITFL